MDDGSLMVIVEDHDTGEYKEVVFGEGAPWTQEEYMGEGNMTGHGPRLDTYYHYDMEDNDKKTGDIKNRKIKFGKKKKFRTEETISEDDMKGMSVSSGHKRSTESGAGLTSKGVAAYRRKNPGSKLKTAVTTPPSKLKAGSKAANRRKSFCARSRGWNGERGKAARRRWNC